MFVGCKQFVCVDYLTSMGDAASRVFDLCTEPCVTLAVESVRVMWPPRPTPLYLYTPTGNTVTSAPEITPVLTRYYRQETALGQRVMMDLTPISVSPVPMITPDY